LVWHPLRMVFLKWLDRRLFERSYWRG
jgi:hypothetical protein